MHLIWLSNLYRRGPNSIGRTQLQSKERTNKLQNKTSFLIRLLARLRARLNSIQEDDGLQTTTIKNKFNSNVGFSTRNKDDFFLAQIN